MNKTNEAFREATKAMNEFGKSGESSKDELFLSIYELMEYLEELRRTRSRLLIIAVVQAVILLICVFVFLWNV